MFSLFRKKSESRPSEVFDPEFDSHLSRSRQNFDISNRNLGIHRYSHYSSVNSGEDSPPRIVLYSRPPENLTSPNREASPDPHLDLVQGAVSQSRREEEHFRQEPEYYYQQHSRVQRKYSKQARSSDDNNKVIIVRRTKSHSGPFSFFRKSFRRNSGKRQVVTSYKVPQSSPSPATPQRNGSKEKISRKFSDPYYTTAVTASTTTAPPTTSATPTSSSRLVPGRATSPKNLITLKPVSPGNCSVQNGDVMFSMVVPETYINPIYSHNNNDDVVTTLRNDNTSKDDALSKRRSIAVAPSHQHATGADHQNFQSFALPQISEQVSNGFAVTQRVLPRPPSNLGVPYYPPPPQAVSAKVENQPQVRKNSKSESSGPKMFSGPSIRPLRISLRSKVRFISCSFLSHINLLFYYC